jgi:uncharacterized protein (TIGR03000 family)
MNRNILLKSVLVCCTFLGSQGFASAQFKSSDYWFGDWQYGLQLYPLFPLRFESVFGTTYVFPRHHPPRFEPVVELVGDDVPTLASPTPLPAPNQAQLRVVVPDPAAVVYLDEKLIDGTGTTRTLTTPALQSGTTYSYQVRAAFRRGDELLIEDRKVSFQAGQVVPVEFDGAKAQRVPLPVQAAVRPTNPR